MVRKVFIKKPRHNHQIKSSEVVIINNDGKVLGTFSLRDAIQKATESDLDLVEISPNSNPPICKIIDYGKFNYLQEKKRKEAKKQQKVSQLKEIKMRPKTDVHDYNFKLKHIKDFIAKGNKVKVTIRFKGREMSFIDLGKKQIEKIINDTIDIAKIDIPAKLEGKQLFMTLSPLKKK